jgi:hypothetical protein
MTRDFEKVIKNVKRFKVVVLFGSIYGFGAYSESGNICQKIESWF